MADSLSFSFSSIPEEVFKNICTIVHICCAIEQANSDHCLRRADMVSLVGAVANSAVGDDGQPLRELNDVVFY